jgi:phosphoribosylaminoimidazolecarboxamide formyltransferase/IMP cyclohydrolase
MRALLSVHDKSGLAELGQWLVAQGVELVATGGTARHLLTHGLPVTEAARLTGFDELLGGRVKTLHPAIHGGLLARPEDVGDLRAQGMEPIDVLVVNLYPFREAWRQDLPPGRLVEEVDIGGVALLRAAAKNFARVTVLADPSQYQDAMRRGLAGWDEGFRLRLAAYAFRLVAAYDADIAEVFTGWAGEHWPERLTWTGERAGDLRYGENPHQAGALYLASRGGGLGQRSRQLQGKALSYNNWADADAAWRLVWELPGPGAVGVKHQMPCGVALAGSPLAAFRRVVEADPVSIFGGIVAFNQPLDEPAANALRELFLEVVLAPEVSEQARRVLAAKPNLRVLEAGRPHPDGRVLKTVTGGWLLQDEDHQAAAPVTWTRETGPEDLLERLAGDVVLAWRVVQHARSNAVVLVRQGMTVGVGQGQTNRIDAVTHALRMAGDRAQGSVLASDAFFFTDTVDAMARAGVALAVSPGGSIRDREVVAAAEKGGVALWFTGERHFRH